jgi:hypothetical protein
LQKAITDDEAMAETSSEDKKERSEVSKIKDLDFIEIIKNHHDLGIVDEKSACLILFEFDSQLQKDK